MKKKQIIALFVCNLLPWIVGAGLVPLLPVYAKQLGADPALAGYYLAFSYFALAVGTVTSGWMSDTLHCRKIPLIAAGFLSIPAAWLMGRVGNIWALSALTAVLWFCGGLGMGLIGILVGLSSGKDERGKIFGILSLTMGLGALIGGLATGFIVDRWGFPTMCSTVAGLLVFWPLAGMFLTEKITGQVHGEDGLALGRSALGKNYYLLFAACLISSVAGFIVILGRSLLMSELGFKAMEIASTGAVGGLIAMPLPLLSGWLSDRTDRKNYLLIGYLACFFSLSILAVSTRLWHFWIVMIFQSVLSGMNGVIGNTMVADLLPPELLGRGLALFGATSWLGGILGFAGAGYTLKSLGVLPTFIIGICLPLVAILLLIPIRSRKERIRPSLQ